MPGSLNLSDSSGVIRMIAITIRKKPTGFANNSRIIQGKFL
jgi:hypothetical protein